MPELESHTPGWLDVKKLEIVHVVSGFAFWYIAMEQRETPATAEMGFAKELKLSNTERRAVDSVARRIVLVCMRNPLYN